MATAKYGKGTVFAVVDPWLYNEYTDPRKALPRQDNFEAGKEFVSWLLKQVPQSRQQVRLTNLIRGESHLGGGQ
jgi:unsaturated rhamnogalacturonyl hydrolase